MRVVVTRPAGQAASWVSRLRDAGVDAVGLPLIAITGPEDPTAVAAAWRTLPARRLVIFVSPNAAQAFFDHAPADATWPSGLQAASPGPGTTALLRELGLRNEQIVQPFADAKQFDSEALWEQLRGRDWHDASVLIARGVGGRDWLTQRLREAGARVEHVAAYRRRQPVLAAAEQSVLDAALAAPADHLWLFSSSEAVDALVALGGRASQASTTTRHARPAPAAAAQDGVSAEHPLIAVTLPALATARAVATHPRIAARAQQRGFGVVHECRPTLEAVIGCIQSLRP